MAAESKLQKYVQQEIAKLGGRAEKFASPANRGVPDLLVSWPDKEPKHCIMDLDEARTHARYVEFIEMKAPGKRPTLLQLKDHEKRRAMGFQVHVIASDDEAEAYLKSRGKR